MNLSEFRRTYDLVDRDGFLETFRAPFLLVNTTDPDRASKEKGGKAAEVWSKSTILSNRSNGSGTLISAVFPLGEPGRKGGEATLTIGRSNENDIPIPNPSISRRHARIDRDASWETFSLADVGSSYGTTLNGAPLPPKQAHRLQNGTTVVFGQVAFCTFFSPGDFFNFLHILDASKEKE